MKTVNNGDSVYTLNRSNGVINMVTDGSKADALVLSLLDGIKKIYECHLSGTDVPVILDPIPLAQKVVDNGYHEEPGTTIIIDVKNGGPVEIGWRTRGTGYDTIREIHELLEVFWTTLILWQKGNRTDDKYHVEVLYNEYVERIEPGPCPCSFCMGAGDGGEELNTDGRDCERGNVGCDETGVDVLGV